MCWVTEISSEWIDKCWKMEPWINWSKLNSLYINIPANENKKNLRMFIQFLLLLKYKEQDILQCLCLQNVESRIIKTQRFKMFVWFFFYCKRINPNRSLVSLILYRGHQWCWIQSWVHLFSRIIEMSITNYFPAGIEKNDLFKKKHSDDLCQNLQTSRKYCISILYY